MLFIKSKGRFCVGYIVKKCREKVDLVIQKLTTKVLELKLHLSKGSYSRKWELGKIDGIEYAISILEEIKNQ